MILVVDMSMREAHLSRYEFVLPVARTLERSGDLVKTVRYEDISRDDLEGSNRAVLCGTALKDCGYAARVEALSWIRDYDRPLLGICAGMQAISSVFCGRVLPRPAIGLMDVDIIRDTPLLGEPRRIEGYHLHNFGAALPPGFDLVAGTVERPDAFVQREGNIYGISFHPEVRNRWVFEKFSQLARL